MPRESWLALDNENHDHFGAAMVLCQDQSGACVSSGRCSRDGDCFRSDMAAYREAAKLVRSLVGDQSDMVASALQEAAGHLDTIALARKGSTLLE